MTFHIPQAFIKLWDYRHISFFAGLGTFGCAGNIPNSDHHYVEVDVIPIKIQEFRSAESSQKGYDKKIPEGRIGAFEKEFNFFQAQDPVLYHSIIWKLSNETGRV
jgi:hypothetical protein